MIICILYYILFFYLILNFDDLMVNINLLLIEIRKILQNNTTK
jgi:hypothetical protein